MTPFVILLCSASIQIRNTAKRNDTVYSHGDACMHLHTNSAPKSLNEEEKGNEANAALNKCSKMRCEEKHGKATFILHLFTKQRLHRPAGKISSLNMLASQLVSSMSLAASSLTQWASAAPELRML